MQSQIEKEADLPVSQQSVLFKGKSLDSGATLTDAGVADGDAVLVVPLKKVRTAAARPYGHALAGMTIQMTCAGVSRGGRRSSNFRWPSQP